MKEPQNKKHLMFDLTFFIEEGKIKRVSFASSKKCSWNIQSNSSNHSLKKKIDAWMELYLQKKYSFSLPIDFSSLPLFTSKVLQTLQLIPFGETITYQELAKKAGQEKGARAIGNICHHNPFPLIVPCHRVIRSDGKDGGFAYGSEVKSSLLHFEKS